MSVFDNEQIKKISENIYLIEAPKKGQFPFCHGFLFTGDENILLDAGTDEEQIIRIDKEIGIDRLIISHSHPDHIRRWNLLSHRELLLPAETPDAVCNIESLGERYVGSRERGLYWVKVVAERLGIVPVRTPDKRFCDGDLIENGTSKIEAIHAPGHLNDHYCFFEHNSATLFTVDIDFTSFGPWYGNPEGSIKPFIKSIRRIMALPYRRVCPSHKPVHEGDATGLFENFIAAFHRQKMEVLSAVGGGKTIEDLVRISPFYGNRFFDLKLQGFFEEHMISENLALLIEDGLVVKEKDVYRTS